MKTYQCPFCNVKLNKDKLLKHIERKHETEVTTQYVGYTPYRLVYDIVNNKPGHGWCVICNSQTGWNSKTQKYFRICKNPDCAKKVREQYKERMLKVYNKITLLDDPKHQEKMLANRRISGTYTWSDGTKYTYTGSYEKEFLEFLDKVMNYDSKDIVVPGPILEYDHKGVKRHWITDCLILSVQLIIEIKDGGNNPNKKNMSVTREKTICKEKMITNQGKYNYLRLTNNNFAQLLGILAEMKMKMIEEDDSKTFRIHEEAEINDKDHYQEQDEIERKCEAIYKNIDARFADLVEVVNGESYLEDGFEDSEVYMACYIHPKIVNDNYEPTFKKLITKINNYLKKTYPKENIAGFWIDEVEPLRGYAIGIEEAAINDDELLTEEPLRYQSTAYDCANAAILNAASYISNFTEIPPIFLKKVNEVCLDNCTDTKMKGTSRNAVKHIANWVNEYYKEADFFIRCELYEGAKVTFLNNSELLNKVKQENTAVVLLCSLNDEHWVTVTDADDNYLYLFDPYYWNEGYNDTQIEYVKDDPFRSNRKIPIDFMETTNGIYYSLTKIKNKLAVVFENVDRL